MVKGLDVFHDYFREYNDQYVLIGGAACSIFFEKQDAAFRAMKDLDMVLIVEALTPVFGSASGNSSTMAAIIIELAVMASPSSSASISRKSRASQR